MKIDDCLEKESVPFLYEHKRNKGEEVEVVITSNIFSELKRYNRSQTNSSNYTLAALASEIPGFKVDQRKINGINKKVVCGPKDKFDEFLTPTYRKWMNMIIIKIKHMCKNTGYLVTFSNSSNIALFWQKDSISKR